ncbi:immunoglobulin-like domain-containing protein [Sporolactobacillus pectinivorans]|uniref:immunoglobulin-like domain-containing protein n=1 Tax=Sporolactobacillus pectinivorans TaxID=1591408 RepID=UPI001390004A|nr:immunoglobulin-like domain-containing protein [Sporolactobacillus pectinivorans]
MGNNPTITGPNEIQINYGSAFNALDGIAASDPKDGDLALAITVSGDTVNTRKPGTYKIGYLVANQACVTAQHGTTVRVGRCDNK